ncbi:MAG: hypothetical protein OXE59_11915 [Bacteroidetes bacterium]|nr:hypothetical protein [Bacteroidota bacterium]
MQTLQDEVGLRIEDLDQSDLTELHEIAKNFHTFAVDYINTIQMSLLVRIVTYNPSEAQDEKN